MLLWHSRWAPTGWLKFERVIFHPQFRIREGSKIGPWIARRWIPISLPLTHKVYLLPCLSIISWFKKRFHPSVGPGCDDSYRSVLIRQAANINEVSYLLLFACYQCWFNSFVDLLICYSVLSKITLHNSRPINSVSDFGFAVTLEIFSNFPWNNFCTWFILSSYILLDYFRVIRM